jgi:integrase
MPATQPAGRRRRINGDGSVYKRQQDGYWVGAFYARTTSGARKRVVVYGKTLDEARDKLGKAQHQARAGIPVPDESWKIGPYLEYWLENIVKRNRRPATYALYETIIRLYLVPGLGAKSLARLSVPTVQVFLNQRLESGDSVRKVQVMRSVLSAALSRAVREELITRNVARHVELPEWRRNTFRPWTAEEAKRFIAASKTDPLHSAFVLLIVYGLRRGEVLGLRWDDIDFGAGTIHVRQQIQRVRGELQLGPVKTHAGQRVLPLLELPRQALTAQLSRQLAHQADMGSAWQGNGLIFTTRTGRPVEPRNFIRSFRRICDEHGIRVITVHHVRHTVASLLKDLRVPARDAQAILGHTRISTTLEIYTDTADEAKRDALTRLHDLFDGAQQAPTATEDSYKPGPGDQER